MSARWAPGSGLRAPGSGLRAPVTVRERTGGECTELSVGAPSVGPTAEQTAPAPEEHPVYTSPPVALLSPELVLAARRRAALRRVRRQQSSARAAAMLAAAGAGYRGG